MADRTFANVDVPQAPGPLEIVTETLRTWRKRAQERRQLAMLSARDAHDLGLSEQQIQFEINKPFWRA